MAAIGAPTMLADGCAVFSGTVRCWGSNVDGRLGGATSDARSLVPVTVEPLDDVVDIGSSTSHACAVRADGSVWCWGQGASGQLGHGVALSSATPVQTVGISSAVAVEVGTRHSCAVLEDATVRCWGANNDGQLGNGTVVASSVPVETSGVSDVADLSIGTDFACARSADGSVRCWGVATSGQIGDGAGGFRRTTASTVAGLSDAVSITTGSAHACAVRSTGVVQCWGSCNSGQLGDGRTDGSASAPSDVVGLTGAVAVDAGAAHTCALLGDGGVRCWGSNSSGQLGRPGIAISVVPVEPEGLGVSTAIHAFGGRSYASTAGSLVGWGSRGDGELGDGLPGYVTEATPVVGT